MRAVRYTLMLSLLSVMTGMVTANARDENFCDIWEIYVKDQIDRYGVFYHDCYNGDCDDPANRDAAIPDPDDPVKYCRLYFHIFCEDDGTNCVTSESILDMQVQRVNEAFLPLRIQFVYGYEFINSSYFRNWADPYELKDAWASKPDSQMNIYITETPGSSFGTFPWDDVRLPLSEQGGIKLSALNVYPQPYHDNVLAHEIGHTLGLWHTHHGVDEVDLCGECYEMADGTDADVSGDLCSDTPPAPVTTSCEDPGGTDSCCGLPWGQTDYHNYMSYSAVSGESCWDHFTAQQWGRMHCWTDAVLSSWFDTEIIFIGDANGSGGQQPIDIDDIVYLVSYVLADGPAPVPHPVASGDADCSCAVDIDDIVYLIDYVFSSGPAPCSCFEWESLCGPLQ